MTRPSANGFLREYLSTISNILSSIGTTGIGAEDTRNWDSLGMSVGTGRQSNDN